MNEQRFKQLKKERNRWWKKEVPHLWEQPKSKDETVPAFHLGKDGTIEKVRVWIDNYNFKRVAAEKQRRQYYLYSSGRTWPTEEGAMYDRVVRAQKVADRCAKASEKANKELATALNNLESYNIDNIVGGIKGALETLKFTNPRKKGK